jgi:hypothetical protein
MNMYLTGTAYPSRVPGFTSGFCWDCAVHRFSFMCLVRSMLDKG